MFFDKYYIQDVVFVAFEDLKPTYIGKHCLPAAYSVQALDDIDEKEIKRKVKEIIGGLSYTAGYEYGLITFRYSS